MTNNIGYRQNNCLNNQAGVTHQSILFLILAFICVFFSFKHLEGHVAADSSTINSGISNYCLNDTSNKLVSNSVVNLSPCNNSTAQSWVADISTITHNSTFCLTVKNSGKIQYSKVVIDPCNGGAGQVWLRDQNGYYNPHSEMCLSAFINNPINQLFVNSCDKLSSRAETLTPVAYNKNTPISPSCSGLEGDKIACYAIKQWTTWQSNTISHNQLLNEYTDNAAYEEWCADFVSYIYKEAGYPFTQGETNGWDENVANNIQNMGFTLHQASSGYMPKAGDVAYFDYDGGHVEIVVSGGPYPTFIYGDSATIDPTTGNGQMMSNTTTHVDGEGQLIYYLSPN